MSLSTRSISPRLTGWIVFTMLATVAVPAAITLHQVRAPAILTVPPDPTLHGYTWSLLLFIIPIAVIAGWFLPSEGMTGISIRAWSGLPFEAVLVWMAVTYATVILFEACKLWQASGRTFREAFLGV